ncbi:MAG: GlsB/YeaQ/YmgE family stress response membrane protein [Chitinophagaceae bacterium]
MGILWQLLVGGIAGWLAGTVVRGGGFGIIVDIVVGLVGGWLGGALGLHIGSGIFGAILTSFLGAVILILVIRALKRVF